MEYILTIILTYTNKCGIQYKTEQVGVYKSEKECRVSAEELSDMYLRTGKTNVRSYEYSCYKRR